MAEGSGLAAAAIAAPPDPLRPVAHRVRSRREETADTVTLTLEPVVEALPPCRPGQFNMLLAFGVGEVPISASEPPQDHQLVHTVRGVGAVTRALCGARPGDVVGVRGPFGTGWDVASAAGRDVVVIAGGIGLAPLRGAVAELLSRRERFGEVAVLVGARSPEVIPFAEDLDSWRSLPDVQVDVTVDTAMASWSGHVGLVTKLIRSARFDSLRTTAFLCGPEVMMRHAARALTDRGVALGDIRLSVERNMECGVGLCGHCQLGPLLLCRDGPVLTYDRLGPLMAVRGL